MGEIKISIIIPVYNVEQYLPQCINSILQQPYSDYEIILVDDGSTDKSGEICDDYKEKNDKIKVIHKENGGLSDARNCGLKNSTGDYILFVDSDDYIEQNSLSSMVEVVKNSLNDIDVVFLEATKVFSDGKKIPLGDGYCGGKINNKSKKDVFAHLSQLPKFPASACTKLIKRNLILENNLYFEKGLLSEDIDWTLSLLKYAQGFAYCNAPYYYYRQGRSSSITNSLGIKNIKDILYIVKKWASPDLSREFQAEYNSFMAYEYMMAVFIYSCLSKDEKKEVKGLLYENKWVLKYAIQRKTKLTAVLLKTFGIDITSGLLRFANNYRGG